MTLMILAKIGTFVAELILLLAGLLMISRGVLVTGWMISAGILVNVAAMNLHEFIVIGWEAGSGAPGWYVVTLLLGQIGFVVAAVGVFRLALLAARSQRRESLSSNLAPLPERQGSDPGLAGSQE